MNIYKIQKQQSIHIEKHNNEEYFLDWIDYRSSGKADLANYYGKTLLKAELLSSSPSCSDCISPLEFSLKPAYPNPFNGNVTFEFSIPRNESIVFKVFDLNGKIVTEKMILPGLAGNYKIKWDGKDMNGRRKSSGIYFYKFISNNRISEGKITYLK